MGFHLSTSVAGALSRRLPHEYVGGRAMNFNDPSGLAWYNPLTWGLGGADESDIQATKDKYCQSQKDQYDQGKMCKDEFEKRWQNGGCGTSVGEEISAAANAGFGEGWEHGYILTANRITFHLIDDLDALADQIWEENADGWYKTGAVFSWIGVAAADAAIVLFVADVAVGVSTRVAIHAPHAGGPHQYWHFQLNWWMRGVRGSGGAFRIPLSW